MSLTAKQSDVALEKRRLRLWIRMLRTTRYVETQVREMLRDKYETTLPRFDVMAALYRAKSKLKMSVLSKQLLVSNGNVTGIVDRLVADGMVIRVAVENDRRAMPVSLTTEGRMLFERMAGDHEDLVSQLFSKLEHHDLDMMADVFSRLKEEEELSS